MLEEISGIGTKTVSYLNAIDIFTINDLITHYPYRYNYYSPISLKDASEESIVVTGVIESVPKVSYIKRNLNRLSFNFNNDNILVNVVIFNRAFLKQHLSINKTITLIGKYNKLKNTFMASDIKLKPIINTEIEPIYHLSYQIKKHSFIKLIQNVLMKNPIIKSSIPDYLENKYNFIDSLTAIKYIHFSNSNDAINQARSRLIYDELFAFMLKINYLKIKNTLDMTSTIKNYNSNQIKDFINSLPFDLTEDQLNALKDIEVDFKTNKRMNRLILGDVGSGKTIVAFIALYINYLAGFQGLMMAPTEILAEQHYQNIINTFNNTDLKIALLTSSTKKKERDIIINSVRTGELDILIGTHSLLNKDVELINLGLVITDEQHRFGVKQRQYLQQKGKEVDVLYLSATPIPRTLALTIYGDMDISQIKHKPHQNEIITKLVKNQDIKKVLLEIVDEIKKGHQIYVVAPMIEEDSESDLENVKELYHKLDQAFNKKIPMSIIHGKLKTKEKEQIMSEFKDNKTKILISTTVIEVGIDIKNATMMVIFNAERYGLATLHQLRGRIGRNEFTSKCIIISSSETERLKILEESNDGFYISEKDFELRGTGDLFGIKQSGDMNFKIADLKKDFKILLQCKEDSEEFLKNNLNEIDKYPVQKEIINAVSFID